MCDGNTHHQVGEFCAVLVGEFFKEGQVALQEYTLDQTKNIAQDINYPNVNSDSIKEQIDEYNTKHFERSIYDALNSSHADETIIHFYDGTELTVCTGDDNFFGMCERTEDKIITADCALKMAEYSDRTFGEAAVYFDKPQTKDGLACGYDVPIASLNKLLSIHGGIQSVEQKTRQIEKDIIEEFQKETGHRARSITLTDSTISFITDKDKNEAVEINLQKQEMNITASGQLDKIISFENLPEEHYIKKAFILNGITIDNKVLENDLER